MTGKSLEITEDKINQLKSIIPEAFAEGKIDWEKLKATLGEALEFKDERYVLNWAGKSDAFRVLQSPTTATLVPAKEESVHFETTQNLFIEGENLEVLKVLQKAYFGKIKMIYIDPPYNTGNDSFIYPDRFAESREDYLARVGDKDEAGYMTREGLFRKNSKDSGHYHSNWLSMMYPRLFLARNLLREDGVIAVSIDDNEVHNLRMLMNEVFGEENFLAQITIITGANQSGEGIQFQKNTEYSIVYSKTAKSDCIIRKDKVNESYRNLNDAPSSLETREEMGYTIYYNKETKEIIPLKDYDKSKISTNDINQVYTDDVELIQKGFIPIRPGIRNKKLHRWRWGIETFKARINEIVIFEKDDNFKVVFKQEGLNPPKSYLNFGGGAAELKEIFDDDIFFDYPKSYKYLKYLVSIGCGKNDIVLDFFSGSSTTAHAVLDLNKEDDDNRQFIMVQMPEACDDKSEAYKAGYKTIADIGKERIRRVIKNIKKEKEGKLDLDDSKQDLGFKVFKLRKSNFKIWRNDTIDNGEKLIKQLDSFKDPVQEGSDTENMLYELLLKSGVELTAQIEKKDGYFLVNNELIVALERMDEKLVKSILAENPAKVITLDRLFEGNDPLKTNTALQMKDAGIEFKTI